jgi:hypothetical protein
MASIDKRPDGKWRARWREHPGGPQSTKSFGRKVDAERWLVKVQHELLTGSYIDPAKAKRHTAVEDFYRVWSARQPWRHSSRASVGSLFEHHVLPTFGTRPLGTVRRGDVESWAAGVSLAGRTAGLAVQYLGTLFEAAVADGLVAVNPVHGANGRGSTRRRSYRLLPTSSSGSGRPHLNGSASRSPSGHRAAYGKRKRPASHLIGSTFSPARSPLTAR